MQISRNHVSCRPDPFRVTRPNNNLNMSYEYVDYSRMENDNKFIKVFELLMEISEKSNTLNKAVRGNYLFI